MSSNINNRNSRRNTSRRSTNRRRSTSRRSSRTRPTNLLENRKITIEEMAWCDADGFRIDINDPITDAEYNTLLQNHEICIFCLEEFDRLRRIVKISCNHFYHGKCLYLYMLYVKTNFRCPICKGDLDIVWPKD